MPSAFTQPLFALCVARDRVNGMRTSRERAKKLEAHPRETSTLHEGLQRTNHDDDSSESHDNISKSGACDSIAGKLQLIKWTCCTCSSFILQRAA